MRTNARTNQGGSIASFIVIGLLLLAGLGGGIYYLAQRGGDTSEQPVAQTPASENDSANEDSDMFNIDNPEESDDARPSEERSDAPAEDESDDSTAPSAPASPSAPQTPPWRPPAQSPASGEPATNQALPQSGPTEFILGATALAALTFVVIVYRRSRQDLADQLS